ncbi:MAG: hypothetical protein J6U84_07875 [Bacteroidales bacterium]|nr:hypothetical protein [Bacteroidales bacterium]
MIELVCADKFINEFERIHKLKVHKIPLEYFDGRSVLLLMCKCGNTWIALPHCNEAYVQTDLTNYNANPLFRFVESQDGNLLCTKNIRWEIRDTRAYSANIYADKINFRIDLQEDLMSLFTSNVRRKIRKSQLLGIEVRTSGKKLIDDFYKVYSRRMFELGSPFSGKDRIKKLLKTKTGKIFVAYLDNTPIGAATLSKRDESSFENGLFATEKKYNHYYTTYALHYAMMQYSLQEGAKSYYLGRSTRHSTVHEYKRHFRPQEIQLYWNYSHPKKNIRDNKILKKLWRLLPFNLSKELGKYFFERIY